MKKVLLFAAFAAFAMTSVNAQDEDSSGFAKSDLFMTGTVGFNSASAGDVDTSSFEVSPTVGYMMTDNLSINASLSFGSIDDGSEVDMSTTGFGVGATYFMAPTSKFSMNVSAGLGYSTASVGDLDVNTLSFAVSPGFNYWIADSWGLVANIAALSYTSTKADVDGAEAVTGFGLNLDLSDINFGMVYKF
jgi:long-subunit fatty acid transport protein